MTTPGGYSAGTIFLQVVPSFKGLQDAIRKEAKASNRTWEEAQKRSRDQIAADDKKAAEQRGRESGGAYSRALSDAISKALVALPKQKIDVDSSAAEAQIQVIRARLEAMDGKKIRIGAEAREATRVLGHLEEELKSIALRETNADVSTNAAEAYAALKVVHSMQDKIDKKRTNAKVDVDTSKGQRGLRGLINQLDQGGNSFRAFNGFLLATSALLPLLAPAAIAAAGAIAGLSVAMGAGIIGIGILVAAFGGIGDAVKALEDVHKNARKDAIAQAKATRNAARQVRDAEESVAQARIQAARSAEQASRRVQDAIRAQRDAERELTDAQKDATKAQKALVDARVAAQKQQQDLANQLAGGALAERQAVIDLFDATVAYNKAMQDGAATNLEKEQASINLGDARLRLKEIREQNKALTEQQKQGVKGDQGVIQAQEGVAAANRKVADAQQKVKDAVVGVHDAQTQQAQDAADSAVAMRNATQSLADAQAAQAETLAKIAEVGSGSQLKLADAMAKLGPAGQAFAIFLEGTVLPALYKIRDAIQSNLLPGLTTLMQTLFGTYGAQMTAFFANMARAIGDVMASFAKALQGPEWRAFIDMMITRGPTLLRQWGQIGIQAATAIIQILTVLAPLATQMLGWLASLTKRFSDFLKSAAGQKMMADFLKLVQRIGPQVKDFFIALVGALWNLGKALAPLGDKLLGVVTRFLQVIAKMDPRLLGAITLAILGVILAVQTAAGLGAAITSLSTAAKAFGLVGAGAEAAGAAVEGASLAAAATLLGWVVVIVAVIAIIVLLWTHCQTFRDIVTGVFNVVGNVITWVWKNLLKPVFEAVIWYVKKLWEVWSAIFDLIWHIFKAAMGKISEIWNAFMKTGAGKELGAFAGWLGDKWGGLVDVVQGIWDKITDIFKGGLRIGIELINNGLIGPFNWLARKFGSKEIKPLEMPSFLQSNTAQSAKQVNKSQAKKNQGIGLATGGVVPGFSPHPRADNIPAMLTAGEYVLPVHAVRALRGQYGDGFLEMLRRGRLPGYASGGSVQSLIAFGKMLQGRGFQVSENPAFGGVTPVHTKNSLHYSGRAIDVNWAPGQSLDEMKHIDAIVGLAKAYGLRVIWRAPGHFNHAHFDTGAGPNMMGSLGSLLGTVGGALKDAAGVVLGAPKDYLLGKLRGLYGGLKDTEFGGLLIGGMESLAGMAADSITHAAGSVGDFLTKDGKPQHLADGGPVLYDNGGWLQPGLTTVLNASGKPEPVFSSQQWEHLQQGGGAAGTGDAFHWHDEGGSPEAFAQAIMFRKRAAGRGGVYAGKVG